MGQYYTPIVETAEGERTLYNRQIVGDDDYNPAKLMEHSWWENEFVNTICNKIYHNPCKIAWVGDYADDFELYDELMKDDNKVPIVKNETKLDGKFLINHAKKLYIDCSEYKKLSVFRGGWCIHPLPLLTCASNGKGGGDYDSEIGADKVGSWCWDFVSVEDTVPDGYEELNCYFREK